MSLSGEAVATAAATSTSLVGRAGEVRGTSAGTQLVDERSILSLLRQLEVSGQQVTVSVSQLVTQSLHGVGVDESAGLLTLCVDSSGDVAGVLRGLVADSVDVAIGLAAALLCSEAVLRNACIHGAEASAQVTLHTAEAVQHAGVHGIEAVAQAAVDAVQLTQDTLVVEAIGHLSTGQSAVVAEAEAAAVCTEHEQEQNDNPELRATTEVVIAIGYSLDVGEGVVIHTHSSLSFEFYFLRGGHLLKHLLNLLSHLHGLLKLRIRDLTLL